jgi:hypothetical protein
MPERLDHFTHTEVSSGNHFTHTEVSSGNHGMGRFVGLKAGLNAVIEKRKIRTSPGIETRMCVR